MVPSAVLLAAMISWSEATEPSLSEPLLSEPLAEPPLCEPPLSEPSLSEPSLSEPLEMTYDLAQRRGDSTGVSTPQRVGRHRRMPCASTLSRLALSFSPSKASGRAESIGGPGGSQGSA
jgi:hypothetical protein